MLKRNMLLTIVLSIGVLALGACSAPLTLASSPFAALLHLAPTAPANVPPAVPQSTAPQPAAPPAATLAAPLPAGPLTSMDSALEQIYNQVNPSVVLINVVQQQTAPSPFSQIPGLPFFGTPPQNQPPQLQQALGSGFVWDTQGHIVTNNHVIDGATQISVTFADGTTVSGKVIGADSNSDLAVVQVNAPANELHPVQMGDSTKVKVGQLAIAIGNPFGEQNTMTTGVISALGRSLPVNQNQTQGPTYTIPDVIQTDAPINPGNSGGVLLNDQGQVIGVTSSIESPVRASSGIGFAIPSEIVQKVVPALIKTGHYEHPYIGISGTTLDPTIAQAMNLNADQRGALVIDVTPNSPAAKAGLRSSTRQVTINGQTGRVGGDVITAINGQPVTTFDDLVAYLARSTEVGQTIKLTILRNGNQQTVDVTLAARPSSQSSANTQSNNNNSNSAATGNAFLGVQSVTLTPRIAQAMNLDSTQTGVLVEQVESGSPADQAGLQGSFKSAAIGGNTVRTGGDVIVAINGQAIKTTGDLQSAVQQDNPGQQVTLTILRNGKQMNVPVTLGSGPTSTP